MAVVLYSATIHQAIARGDVEEMRQLVTLAQDHVSEWGNMPVALELLKAELARAEQHGG